jgi:predicted enzyme related to lactoylglutathione lyase
VGQGWLAQGWTVAGRLVGRFDVAPQPQLDEHRGQAKGGANHRLLRDAAEQPVEQGMVFFLGGGFLELSGRAAAPPAPSMALWLQVRELAAARRELGERGVPILREPKREPWGLLELWIADPDGVRICIVEVPQEHPLRRRN